MILPLLEFALCILAIAWLSMAEAACFSLSRIEVRRLAQSDPRGAVLARLLADPPRLFSTIVVLNTTAAVAASTAAVSLLEQWVPLTGSALAATTTVAASLVLLIAGDVTPKTFAVHHAESVALTMARPLAVWQTALHPLTRALAALGRGAARLVRPRAKAGSRSEDLLATIDVGRKEGVLARDERTLLVGALVSARRTVADVMLAWPRVVTVPDTASIHEALEVMRVRRVGRTPLVDPDGRVRGILRVQDLMAAVIGGRGGRPALESMRPAFYVSRDTTWGDALRAIQRDRSYVLLVGAPGRRPAGLVAMRDLVTELVDAEHEETA